MLEMIYCYFKTCRSLCCSELNLYVTDTVPALIVYG
jgi:hypothetical protein